MILHVRIDDSYSMRSGTKAARANYRVSPVRLSLSLLFVVIVMSAAFVAKALEWQDAAVAFLHSSELIIGGLIGLLIGENAASKT